MHNMYYPYPEVAMATRAMPTNNRGMPHTHMNTRNTQAVTEPATTPSSLLPCPEPSPIAVSTGDKPVMRWLADDSRFLKGKHFF